MNFLACGPSRPVVSRMKGTRLMCGYLSNLFFSALLAICLVLCWLLRPGTDCNRREQQRSDRTVKAKDEIHPSVFSLSVDNTSESR